MMKSILMNLVFLGVVGGNLAMAIEETKYQVIEKQGAFEVRSYESHIVAQTLIETDDPQIASNQGFKVLAGYIFGENSKSEKMKMTAPVSTVNHGDRYQVSFLMESKYRRSELPEPLDQRVNLVEVRPAKFAVIRYTGSWSESNRAEHEIKLKEWIDTRGLKAYEEPSTLARYNSPATLWFLRRNEVLIRLYE
jgi:hypothetical protein